MVVEVADGLLASGLHTWQGGVLMRVRQLGLQREARSIACQRIVGLADGSERNPSVVMNQRVVAQ